MKFEKPLWFDEKYPGGKYIVVENQKSEIYQDENGLWHGKDLEETELRLNYKLGNGSYGIGLISDFADKNFEVIENIFENKKAES